MNNLFDNDQTPVPGQSEESRADEVLEETYEEVETSAVVSKALERIEQAQLYKTLLEHDLFGPGSARPDIQEAVQSEIRDFILERLEILVGLRTEGQTTRSTQSDIKLPFSEEQIGALQALADRVIKKDNKLPEQVHSPTVVPLAAQPERQPVLQQPKTQNVVVRTVQVKTKTVAKTAPKGAPKKVPSDTEMVIYEGVQMTEAQMERQKAAHGQVVAPPAATVIKPLPMPTAAQMNAQNAMAAAGNEQAFKNGGPVSQLLNLAIMGSMKKNANIREE